MTDSEWDDYADGWDDDPAARAYAAAAFASLESLLGELGVTFEGLRVCDFGAGTGLLTERLVAHGASVDAVDSSPAMLAVLEAKATDRDWTIVRTMSVLDERSEPYDLVVCSSVCGFLDDYPGTVTSLAGTLRGGGTFVQWDWEADPASGEDDGLSRAAIESALAGASLEGIRVGVGFEIEFDGHTMAPLMGSGRRPAQ
jgi:2-polyprenyl-3-methyl-5-hydroxy-6-metoxy-1,4-benzoquinol methylase